MKLSYFLLCFSLAMGLWLPACTDCGNNKITPFAIEGLDAQLRIFTQDDILPYLHPDTIHYSEAAIEITLYPEIRVSQGTGLFSSFLPAAYACDPVIPASKDTIESIAVIARNSFEYGSQTFEAGEDISSLFYVTDDTGQRYNTIEDFVNSGFPATTYHTPQFYLRLGVAPQEPSVLPINLTIKPSSRWIFQYNQHEFRVKL